jgi:peptidyl-prolyl cis-trans isomerase SurA
MAAPFVLGFVLAGLFAEAIALDRIAAVVDDQPIFLSEVRKRAAPLFYRIDFMGGDAKERDAAKATTLRETVERMIDERLEAAEGQRMRLTVDDSEIESALKAVAAQAKMSSAELVAEAKKQAMTETEYREEIRRQILEGKLVQLHVRGRVKVGEAEARNVYATWAKEQQGPNEPVDLRMLVLRIAQGATPDQKKAKNTLATHIASQAKGGADICTLVTNHTDDPSTKTTCGSRGPMPRSLLLADIAKTAAPLKPGETAEPILFVDPAGAQAYLVIQRAPGAAAAIPTFEKVKEQMMERAWVEATERERKLWLHELRKTALVEVKP